MNEIHCITINSAEDSILVTCNQSQIYTAKLWGADMTMIPEIACTEMGVLFEVILLNTRSISTLNAYIYVSYWKIKLYTVSGWSMRKGSFI